MNEREVWDILDRLLDREPSITAAERTWVDLCRATVALADATAAWDEAKEAYVAARKAEGTLP